MSLHKKTTSRLKGLSKMLFLFLVVALVLLPEPIDQFALLAIILLGMYALAKKAHSGDFDGQEKHLQLDPKEMTRKDECPVCHESEFEYVGNKRKTFSIGKAVGGGILTGGIGTLAGFIGKEGKKNKYVCKSCGEVIIK